jgi:hypothetical protein
MTKAHILDEIKRTAAANGGKPLGWRKFLSETGIRESDWHTVYWARWSDALREAGFTPNQLTEAYETAELLDRYADLVIELGKLPTSADMRFKSRRDPGFPHDATYARLGSKADLIAQLLEHCRGKDGYQDVVRLCEEYVPRKKRAGEDPVPNGAEVSEEELGFVHLMKSGRFHKIGRSNSAGRREYELRIQLPEPLTLVHAIRTDDPPGIEAYWHNRFAAKRKNGEWFELDAADVRTFKRRKFM